MAASGGGSGPPTEAEAHRIELKKLKGPEPPPGAADEERISGPHVIKKLPDSTGLRRVLVVYTGGTIGMKKNAEGSLEPAPEYLVSRMRDMYEFSESNMPEVDVIELLPLVDSSDMGPYDWMRIAKLIEEKYLDYDGFVVCTGTDTMAHCATGLSFIMENLGKPVLLTGAMVPMAELYNDARRNLIVSILLAASIELPEVAIFMNDSLLRGNRSVKVDSSGLDAFASPNFPALAVLGTRVKVAEHLFCPHPRSRLRIHPNISPNIGVIRLVPGFSDAYIFAMIRGTNHLDGLIVELYGSGNAASRKSHFIEAMKEAIDRGVLVAATSQCRRGRVTLSSYALGRKLHDIGVISAADMTTECAAIKLGYLFGRNYPPATIRRLFVSNIRGELTPLEVVAPSSTPPSEDFRSVLPLVSMQAKL